MHVAEESIRNWAKLLSLQYPEKSLLGMGRYPGAFIFTIPDAVLVKAAIVSFSS